MANNKPLSGPQLLLISLILAGTAVICNLVYIGRIQSQTSQQTMQVYMLTRTIQPGEVLRGNDLKPVTVPRSFEPSLNEMGYVDSVLKETYLGSKVTTTARQGELLTHRLFASSEEVRVDDIKPGNRLVSLPINARTAPAMLRAGVYVDLEGAFNTGGAIPQIITVMERVELKAVGSRTINDEASIAAGEKPRSGGGNPNTITIEVQAKDASTLAALQRLVVGSFELQIRNANDTTAAKLTNVSTINPVLVELVRQRQTEAGAARPKN